MRQEGRGRARDRELGMDRPIARRDFLNGAAIAIGAALAGPAFGEQGEAQDEPGYYPPALTGMRGSHPGSFEAAHRLRDVLPLPPAAPDAAEERYATSWSSGARNQWPRRRRLLSRGEAARPGARPRQPRRFRRARQAQRICSRRPNRAHERGYVGDRHVRDPTWRRRRGTSAGARRRSGRAR